MTSEWGRLDVDRILVSALQSVLGKSVASKTIGAGFWDVSSICSRLRILMAELAGPCSHT
ncbi:MAG: hypothetical protein CBE43_04115 [Rhodopirellula sp. TMED283]|nr:MAG: hypothetical protein CBE43_04115 [Rhodopirellula sp. TMED283]